jgi:polyhydroxyalkanoic acid synthase PhaR subunit
VSNNPSSPAQAPDPFAIWRDWLSTSERQWNEFLNQVMATDEFGQALGSMMDAYLNSQRNFSEAFGRYFSALNMPTRTDVLTLGNRLTEIEERLASIESLLRDLAPVAAEPAPAPAPVARPPRTKRPPED